MPRASAALVLANYFLQEPQRADRDRSRALPEHQVNQDRQPDDKAGSKESEVNERWHESPPGSVERQYISVRVAK
ncbi:MAG: hypothetical protein ABI614_26795 [Planctomycetota bacterium]